MKKRLLIISVAVIISSLCIGGTLAYFTAGEIARNVITTGGIDIELIETDAEGNPFENVSDVLPGAKVSKVVTVKNTSDNYCWVRVRVEKEIVLASGKEGTPDTSLIGIDFNKADWIEIDGVFYYGEKLGPGETTEPLFTTVTFDTSMDNLYQGSTASITVGADAVQSDNNGSSVTEAAGWPEN